MFKVGDKVTCTGPSVFGSYLYSDGKPHVISRTRGPGEYTVADEVGGLGNFYKEHQLSLYIDPVQKVADQYQFDAGVSFTDGKLIITPVRPEQLAATLDHLCVPKKPDIVVQTLIGLGWRRVGNMLVSPFDPLHYLEKNDGGHWTYYPVRYTIKSTEEAHALHTLLKGQTR